MQKLNKTKTKTSVILSPLLFCILLGCETAKQNNASVTPLGYSQLDQNNPKDTEFFQALSKNLEEFGSLITVSADTQELNQYREGKRPYPTNYRYTIQPSSTSKVSLEDIKHANLSLH